MPHTLIIGINSDIGTDLAKKFIAEGYQVTGTWRSQPAPVDTRQVHLDLSSGVGLMELEDVLADEYNSVWDNLIFCAGNPLPLTKFVDCNIGDWERSIDLNGTAQLGLFHFLYNIRGRSHSNPAVCFLSAGGVSSCPKEFSAYTLGKTVLAKACELIAAECPELNIFSYGPGWVPTKTHKLMAEALPDGERKTQILDYINNPKEEFDDVMKEVYWDIFRLLKDTRASGRNWARGMVDLRFINLRFDCETGKLRVK